MTDRYASVQHVSHHGPGHETFADPVEGGAGVVGQTEAVEERAQLSDANRVGAVGEPVEVVVKLAAQAPAGAAVRG